MTLEQLPAGVPGTIVSIDAGFGLRRRLEQMGLQPGDLISVTSHAPFHGPLLVCARGCQTALGRGVARRIEVLPADTSEALACTPCQAGPRPVCEAGPRRLRRGGPRHGHRRLP
ncbi:MAG: FeoA family protein [Candidatus Bipolaricaulis sp.]|nr:FeoA family protein [Candidatus Bipolaricaulis sp.]